MALIRGSGMTAVAGRNRRSCSLVHLFNSGGRGGAVVDVAGERQGLERAGSRSLGRGGSREWRHRELVTIEAQALAILSALGGADRIRGRMPIVPEKAEIGAVLEETAPSGEPQAS
jgi:hypothetical protein